ncbi:galactosylceramide sulfotransferase-like isoform X1 [Palaemon carinicauda]|uniref:galactosylceramide sulfotransferase-like isoform X1 n=1 Tax=Palaemon carinicauda TaxID=392227 RepID=UPI0035B638B8
MMKAPVNLSRVTIKRISLFLILIGSGSYLHFIGGLTYSRTKLFSPSNQMIVEPERPTGYIKPTFEDIIDQDSYNLPGLIKDQTQETCSAVTNIAFLKTHKCASSAIQNILFRYGFQHNLLFALPKTGNYFGIGTPFHDSMVRDTPWFKLGLNIFAIHTKWNQEKVMNVMPKDSVYITIVREPTALFESLYTFLKMTKIYKQTLDKYVASRDVDTERYLDVLGYNQMSWDFGAPKSEINDLTFIQEMVKKADKDFDLVMVAERMEESLILMSRLLCWNITDVLVLKVNARMSNFKKKINKKTKRLLRRKLAPDYLIYNFFSQKFDKLVERYGRKRMAEDVSKLRKATEKFRTECGIQERTSKDLNGVNKPWSEQVSGYQSQSKSIVCQLMSFSEIPFMHGLRERQMSLYNKTFGSKEIGGK